MNNTMRDYYYDKLYEGPYYNDRRIEEYGLCVLCRQEVPIELILAHNICSDCFNSLDRWDKEHE